MGGDPKSISEVQEAESKASKLVDEANKEKDRTVAAAKEKAAKMIADANASSKERKAEAIKEAIGRLDIEKKKSIEQAVRASHKVKDRRLGVREKELIVKKLADMILGV